MSGVVLVVFGLLFQEIDHCSETFSFFIILFFLLCTTVMPIGQYVVAEAGCN
jgi:hypothetical protein